MYSTVKRMDGCEYFIEIITVSLKDLIAAINYFENKLITAEKIIQTMDDCKFSCQNKYSTTQRIDEMLFLLWYTTLLQGPDGCN